jgi:L-2-hydroxyglutarate oxidase
VSTLRCAVIGGGIIGVSVARELSRRLDGVEVTVYEKEGRLAAHQTGHNSGVVHAGLYYQPGGLKATLCRRGTDLLKEFCEEKSLPFKECGKLVIARDSNELLRLREIFDRAKANNVPGIRMLNAEQILGVEQNAVGVAALHSPSTAIVDYAAVTNALAADVLRAGGQVLLNREVTHVTTTAQGVTIASGSLQEHYDLAVICGGLQSDRLAHSSGDDQTLRIIPFFGKYFLLEPKYRDATNGLIYPVPNPRYPFLGVHLTKRIDGETLVGPNAFLAFGRESYAWNQFDIRDVLDIGLFPGFWKFSARNLPAAGREIRTLMSRGKFKEDAEGLVPLLKDAKLVSATRGIRAQAMTDSGELIDDFVITQQKYLTQVRNAPSPGATSAMAIAEYVVNRALENRA